MIKLILLMPIAVLSSLVFLTGCDTSIGDQIEKKLARSQEKALSPTEKLFNTDEQDLVIKGNANNEFNLPDLENHSSEVITESQLFTLEQLQNRPVSELQKQAEMWQEMDLAKHNEDNGNTIKIQ